MARGLDVQLEGHFLNRRRTAALVVALVTLLSWSGQASAQSEGDGSAVDEYVEDVPTGGGSMPVGGGGSGNGSNTPGQGGGGSGNGSSTPGQGGRDVAGFDDLATSPAYGAPQEMLPRKKKTKKADAAATPRPPSDRAVARPEGEADDPSAGEALSAVGSAAQGGDGVRLIALLVGLGLVSVAGLAFAAFRHASRSP